MCLRVRELRLCVSVCVVDRSASVYLYPIESPWCLLGCPSFRTVSVTPASDTLVETSRANFECPPESRGQRRATLRRETPDWRGHQGRTPSFRVSVHPHLQTSPPPTPASSLAAAHPRLQTSPPPTPSSRLATRREPPEPRRVSVGGGHPVGNGPVTPGPCVSCSLLRDGPSSWSMGVRTTEHWSCTPSLLRKPHSPVSARRTRVPSPFPFVRVS